LYILDIVHTENNFTIHIDKHNYIAITVYIKRPDKSLNSVSNCK